MKLWKLAPFVAALTLSLLAGGPAHAHYLGYDSVDGSSDIDYSEVTKYNTALNHAISEWNALGGVDIQPDTAWTSQDLRIRDKDRSDVSWAGKHLWIPGWTDYVTFNEYYMDTYSSSKQKNVAVHEFGHALGLDHSYSGQVMYDTVSTVTTPQSHDQSDYNNLW